MLAWKNRPSYALSTTSSTLSQRSGNVPFQAELCQVSVILSADIWRCIATLATLAALAGLATLAIIVNIATIAQLAMLAEPIELPDASGNKSGSD